MPMLPMIHRRTKMLNSAMNFVVKFSLFFGFFSLLPSMLISAALGGSAKEGLLYSLMFTLGLMVVLPFPAYRYMKRQKLILDNARLLVGKGSVASKSTMIDEETGKAVECVLCFDKNTLIVAAVSGTALSQITKVIKADNFGIRFDKKSMDLSINLPGKKSINIFLADPKIISALSLAGWRVSEISED